jgi:hypothetical protein
MIRLIQSALPSTVACAIAFKEWAGVCHALGAGRQSLILRKGGIAEHDGRFLPEHDRFWLWPTSTHQQQQGLREPAWVPATSPNPALETLVQVEETARIDNIDQIRALAPFHVWTQETVEARFHYHVPGLWLMVVRAFHSAEPVVVADRPEFRGCHSWVALPEPIPLREGVPVVSDDTHSERVNAIRAALRTQARDLP